VEIVAKSVDNLAKYSLLHGGKWNASRIASLSTKYAILCLVKQPAKRKISTSLIAPVYLFNHCQLLQPENLQSVCKEIYRQIE